MADPVQRLERLNLITSVCQVLERELDFSDRTLAEFLVTLAESSSNLGQFVRKLEENEADFGTEVASTLYSTIVTGRAAAKSAAESAKREAPAPALPRPERDHRMRDEDRAVAPRHLDAEPVMYGIYEGRVDSVSDGWCEVELDSRQFTSVRQRLVGQVRLQNIQSGGTFSVGRARSAKDWVRRGQHVWVKVISVMGGRLQLSMKDVDQVSGRDLLPQRQNGSSSGTAAAESTVSLRDSGTWSGPSTAGVSATRSLASEPQRMTHRPPSPEQFAVQQLVKSGVLPAEMNPMLDEDGAAADAEEDVDVELVDDEPPFLVGQTHMSRDLSPVKVVKNPEGSLQKAAMAQSTLVKERRELQVHQQREMLDAIPKDMSTGWHDPTASATDRLLAEELRSLGSSTLATPGSDWKASQRTTAISFGKISTKSLQEQREELPIRAMRDEFIEAMRAHQVMIVVGETGSGKTTQMTQYLAEAGFTSKGIIGCTQPRRVAAISVAERVAEEVGCQVGQEVGFTVRFQDVTSPDTVIKYMTDGMLLREYLLDADLRRYSVIILDEAHERTVNTDVLFGLLKSLVKKRTDLRVIITSATVDADRFSEYWFDCPIMRIPGRMFKVTIHYLKDPATDYLEVALTTVLRIHVTQPAGDILLFLTGQEEIDNACQKLHDRMKALSASLPELIILPVYGAQPTEMQSRIFEPAPKFTRKCVVATNIAEASLTIDGIYYVVDPGFCKLKVFNPKTGMDSLAVVPISQASAVQRAGRAGRTGPGQCYRLYTREAFMGELLPATVPEIQRSNLAAVVLSLKAMGISDLLSFGWMDPPTPATLMESLQALYALGALDEEGLLTKIGRRMAEFPLDPALSKILLISVEMGCSEEILTIVSMLSVESIFFRPKERQSVADQKHAKFYQPEGDHLTLLVVYDAWKHSGFNMSWCQENFLQGRNLKKAHEVRKQLQGIMDRHKLDLVSCGKDFARVRRAICSGFFTRAAKRDPVEGYKTYSHGQSVYIHPSSSLFQKNPDCVIYHELVLTTKEYMRNVMVIDPKWLYELAPRFFKKVDPHSLSKRKKQEKIEPLYDRFNPPDMWRLSKRRM
jgi:ATP-dependent RNA helicase DHX8/PRP22